MSTANSEVFAVSSFERYSSPVVDLLSHLELARPSHHSFQFWLTAAFWLSPMLSSPPAGNPISGIQSNRPHRIIHDRKKSGLFRKHRAAPPCAFTSHRHPPPCHPRRVILRASRAPLPRIRDSRISSAPPGSRSPLSTRGPPDRSTKLSGGSPP